MRKVPFIDATAVHNLEILIKSSQNEGIHIVLSGVNPQVRQVLLKSGIDSLVGEDHICDHITKAVKMANRIAGSYNAPIDRLRDQCCWRCKRLPGRQRHVFNSQSGVCSCRGLIAIAALSVKNQALQIQNFVFFIEKAFYRKKYCKFLLLCSDFILTLHRF